MRISTEIVASIGVDIRRSVALLSITHFVTHNGDFGTQGDRTWEFSEGAHEPGGQAP
jgi:hypothetical protein